MPRRRGGRTVAAMSELTINGIRLYYEEHGSGPPILCIHGAGSTSLAWYGRGRHARASWDA